MGGTDEGTPIELSRWTMRLMVRLCMGLALCSVSLFAGRAQTVPVADGKDELIGVRLVTTREASVSDPGGPELHDAAGKELMLQEGDEVEIVGFKYFDVAWAHEWMPQGRVLSGKLAGKTVTLRLEAEKSGGKFWILRLNSGASYYQPVASKKVREDLRVEELVRLAQSDPEWQVRYLATLALTERADNPAAFAALVPLLGDGRREVWELAGWELEIRAGQDPNAIGGAEHPEMYKPLIASLVEQLKRHPERGEIVGLLRRAGPAAMEAVVKLIEPPYTQPTAMSAASILYEYGEAAKPHMAVLQAAADAGNNWALAATVNVDLDGALKHLTEGLISKDAAVRRRAAEELQVMGPLNVWQMKDARAACEAAVKALVERIGTGNGEELRSSVRALPWFGKYALPAVESLKRLAAQAPKEISGEEIKDVISRIEGSAGAE
jgi:hypothetical protein